VNAGTKHKTSDSGNPARTRANNFPKVLKTTHLEAKQYNSVTVTVLKRN